MESVVTQNGSVPAEEFMTGLFEIASFFGTTAAVEDWIENWTDVKVAWEHYDADELAMTYVASIDGAISDDEIREMCGMAVLGISRETEISPMTWDGDACFDFVCAHIANRRL